MRPQPGLAGKTVLVTGAAGGIGQATARVLLERGARVLLTDRDDGPLAAFAQDLGGAAAARAADLCDAAAVSGLFEWTAREFGGVDHLVNNAGIVTQGPFATFSDADWQRVLDVNLTAVYRCSKAYAAQRQSAGHGGAIVNLASMSYKGMTQQAAYVASKGGVVSLTKACAMELARQGIRANAVAPGMTETSMVGPGDSGRDSLRERMIPQIPLRRYAAPREIATAIAFLLSDDASYITGEVLHVAGGARL